jgi:hypothetical protein
MQQFPNPENQELFSYLISNWQLQKLPPEKVFESSPHPELVELFDELSGAFGVRDIRKATIYGKRLCLGAGNARNIYQAATKQAYRGACGRRAIRCDVSPKLG